MNYFLGVDGGQSHTTALIADEAGNILGRGLGGESNHTRAPGGRERLETAIIRSVGDALQQAGLIPRRLSAEARRKAIHDFKFASAHLAMTGEPKDKTAIARTLLRARRLITGHDAPAALMGALPDVGKQEARIVVLAGTGSVVYGECRKRGRIISARTGGRGYLFSDEGSAFFIAQAALRTALRIEDKGQRKMLNDALKKFFRCRTLAEIAENFYAGAVSRERFASFATEVSRLAEKRDEIAAQLIAEAARALAEMVHLNSIRLGVVTESGKDLQAGVSVSYSGGVFKSSLLKRKFTDELKRRLPQAEITLPHCGPDAGALLLAYRNAGMTITESLFGNVAGKN